MGTAQNFMPGLPPNPLTQYPRGLKPRCRPYGANEYDQCLSYDYADWQRMLANGGLKARCPSGRRKYIDPPWVSMPAGGRRFRPIAVAPLTDFETAGVFSGIDTVVLQEKVPLGYDGVISEVVCQFTGSGFQEGSGDITWRLAADYLIDGNTPTARWLRDMGAIITSLGSLTQPSPVPRGGLRVYSGDLVTFYAAIDPAAVVSNGNVIVSVAGWFWPR